MGLTIHLSCVYDNISSYRVSFSLMTIMMMMVLGPGRLVRALFHLPLKNPLVMSVSQKPLVVSVDYFLMVVSVEYFQLIESQNMLVVSVD